MSPRGHEPLGTALRRGPGGVESPVGRRDGRLGIPFTSVSGKDFRTKVYYRGSGSWCTYGLDVGPVPTPGPPEVGD